MPLVEVVPWSGTDRALIAECQALMSAWKKLPVIASDTPGFIVNRIARPFYGEAIRIAEEGIADYATIDCGDARPRQFRMGPFELMDFIGNDVNFAVTKSVFEAMFYDPRYRPSLTQQRLVEAGVPRAQERARILRLRRAARRSPSRARIRGARAADLRARCSRCSSTRRWTRCFMRVASPADIELAMTKGVNYPKGLLAWGDEIGAERVLGG